MSNLNDLVTDLLRIAGRMLVIDEQTKAAKPQIVEPLVMPLGAAYEIMRFPRKASQKTVCSKEFYGPETDGVEITSQTPVSTCVRPWGHDGFHSDVLVVTPEPAPPAVRYELPGQPVTGRHLLDCEGATWVKRDHDEYQHVRTYDPAIDQDVPIDDGDVLTWGRLLSRYAPLELLDLTPAELESEKIYGPIGARWGNPDEPCPYIAPSMPYHPDLSDADYRCSLGRGHVGVHTNAKGAQLGVTQLDQRFDAAGREIHSVSVVTEEDRNTPCTCHRPDAHQPGCPRYERIAHPAGRFEATGQVDAPGLIDTFDIEPPF